MRIDNKFNLFRFASTSVIEKNCYRRFYWDIIMTVTFLYIFVTVPHIICFYRIGKSSDSEYWNIVYPTYAICIIDIFLNFITGFVSPDGHEIFLDATLIARWLRHNTYRLDLLIFTDHHPFFLSFKYRKMKTIYVFKQTLCERIFFHWPY